MHACRQTDEAAIQLWQRRGMESVDLREREREKVQILLSDDIMRRRGINIVLLSFSDHDGKMLSNYRMLL